METKRYIYMDALRILACLSVIYMHVNDRGQFMFAYQELASAPYFLNLAISVFTKMAVPVFFAISGALLLHREIPLKELYTGKILRMAVVLAVFSAVSYAAAIYQGHAQWGIKTFIFGMYDSTWNYSYWYLYAYLAFLMIQPVLSSLVRHISRKNYLYLLLLAVVFRSLLPAFEQWRWEGAHKLNASFSLACITCDIVLYPCLGYFLHHCLDEKLLRRAAWGLFAAALCAVAASVYLTYRETTKTWIMHIQKYHELFAPIICAAVFSAAKCAFALMNENSRAARWLTALARNTFGIYLLHLPVLQVMEAEFTRIWNGFMAVGLPQTAASVLYCMTVFVVCAVPVWILRRIPLMKKLLA